MADFLTRASPRVRRLLSTSPRESRLHSPARRSARAGACDSLSGLARPRERYRRKHLCGCQSAALRQPQTHQREHRRRAASIYGHRHRRRGPARRAPGLRYRSHSDRRPLDLARQISGALAGRWLRLREAGKYAEITGLQPSAAIPPAPTATVFSACQASSIASMIPPTLSPLNIRATAL